MYEKNIHEKDWTIYVLKIKVKIRKKIIKIKIQYNRVLQR